MGKDADKQDITDTPATDKDKVKGKARRRKSVRFSDDSEPSDMDITRDKKVKTDKKETNCDVAMETSPGVVTTTRAVCDSDKDQAADSVIVIGDTGSEESEENRGNGEGSGALFDSVKDSEKKADTCSLADETQDISEQSKEKKEELSQSIGQEVSSTTESKQLKISDILSPSSQASSMDLKSSQSDGSEAEYTTLKRRSRGSRSASQDASQLSARKSKSKGASSPSKRSKSLESVKSPTKQKSASKERKSTKSSPSFANTLDKWVNKESRKSSSDNEVSSSLPETKKLNRSFLLGHGEDESKKVSNSAPVFKVIAEDSQQFSPSKLKGFFRSKPGAKDEVVEETPMKEDGSVNVSVDETQNATKTLFVGESEKVIPDTEMAVESIPESQVPLFDDSLNKSKSDKESDVSITLIEDTEMSTGKNVVKFRPMVKLQKLSQEDVAQYSPKIGQIKLAMVTGSDDVANNKKASKKNFENKLVDVEPIEIDASHGSIGFTTKQSQETVIHLNATVPTTSSTSNVVDLTNISMNLSQPTSNEKKNNTDCDTSQLELTGGIEPMDISSNYSEDSDSTIVTKSRRRCKPPAWFKDMNIESPTQIDYSQSSTSGTVEKKKRGRPRKLKTPQDSTSQTESSGPSSQSQVSSSCSEKTTEVEDPKEDFRKAFMEPTLAGEVNDSFDSDAFSAYGTGKKLPKRRSLKLQKKEDVEESVTKEKDKEVVSKDDTIEKDTKSPEVAETQVVEQDENVKKGSNDKEAGVKKKEVKKSKSKKQKAPENSESLLSKEKSSNKSSSDSNVSKKKVAESDSKSRKDKLSTIDKISVMPMSDSEDDVPLTLLGKPKDSLDLAGEYITKIGKQKDTDTPNPTSSEEDDIPLKRFLTKPPKKMRKVTVKKILKKKLSKERDTVSVKEEENPEVVVEETKTVVVKEDTSEVSTRSEDSELHAKEDSTDDPDTTRDIEKDLAEKAVTSTPLRKVKEKSPILSSSKKNSLLKKRLSFHQKQLTINMNTSPTLGKRLRSSGPGASRLSKRALNRSVDSALPKMRQKRKRVDSEDEDEEALNLSEEVKNEEGSRNTETENGDNVEASSRLVETKVEIKHMDKEMELTKPANTDEENPIPESFQAILAKSSTSSPSKSPVKKSPPKKGKPFDRPETPTSVISRRFPVCRADLIIHRSKLLLNRKHATPSPSSLKNRIFKSPSQPSEKLLRTGILKNSPPNVGLSPAKVSTASVARLEAVKGSPPPSVFR